MFLCFFLNTNYFENDYIVWEADFKNDTRLDQGWMQIKWLSTLEINAVTGKKSSIVVYL
jgi:hypothetical protein